MQEGLVIMKLKRFMQRYHSVQLLKGVVFLLLGSALLFFFVGGVEYLFWLDSTGRLILLGLLIAVLAYLLYRYLLSPLRWLLQLGRNWDLEEAAREIGKYFPEIEDRLLNYLQLRGQEGSSELLDAALEQKSKAFEGISFVRAVSTRDLKKVSLLLLLPAGLFISLLVFGVWKDWSDSYTRVANYRIAYEPPAPFRFLLLNERLEYGTHESFHVKLRTEGISVPEQVYVVYQGKERLMQKNGNEFKYAMNQGMESGVFYFKAGRYRSRPYDLVIRDIPRMLDFKMTLQYPNYLGKSSVHIAGSGNAIVPEGTKILWVVETTSTDHVLWTAPGDTVFMRKQEGSFTLNKQVFRNLDYEVSSSNEYYKGFEALQYGIEVIPDESPRVDIQQVMDSLALDELKLEGSVTDDYGLERIRLGAYRITEPDSIMYRELPVNGELFSAVRTVFPTTDQKLEPGGYRVFIEGRDNDGNRNGKWSRSKEFDYRVSSLTERDQEQREEREGLTRGMERSLEKLKKANAKVQEYQEGRKDAQNMRFSERDQLKSALEEQIQQEQMMKRFSQELQKNLENNEDARILKERLKRQEQLAERNQRLLDELKKMAEELDSEELKRELDESAKNQRAQQRSLEQLVELTKRFLLKEKLKELEQKFRELSERQGNLAKQDTNPQLTRDQDSLRSDFKRLQVDLKKTLKKNEELRKPMPLGEIEGVERKESELLEQIQEFMQKEGASERLRKQLQRSQERLVELAELLKSSRSGGQGMEQQREDAETLRKIIDNLVEYTFEQEALVDLIEQGEEMEAIQSRGIRKQMELRELFGHVDDSLFSLSLRQEDISEFVNEQIEEVYYNIDRALERIAENQIYQGGANQQYALSAGNRLAGFLANTLDNMQEELNPNSDGEGENEFQLDDIIQSQQELKGKLGEKEGSEGQESEEGDQGQEGEEGDQGQKGEKGQEGQKGQEGKNGNQGNKGDQGRGGQGGQNGQEGNKGKGQGKNDREGGQGKGESKSSQKGEGPGKGNGLDGMSEEQLEELLEIYKEQQQLRTALEKQLSDKMGKAEQQLLQRAIREMQSVENELLRNGVTQQTRNRMNQIEQRLLQLKGASFQQERERQRQSQTNREIFSGMQKDLIQVEMGGRSVQEELIAKPLPINVQFKSLIRSYFKAYTLQND